MARLTPTTSPARLSSGPPELPGLMAASVWMRSPAEKNEVLSASRIDSSVRPLAETMPMVIVPLNPKGLPMATTVCPTLSRSESPSGTGTRSAGLTSTLTTARSESRSVASTSPRTFNPEEKSTSSSCAPSTTW